MTNIPAVQVQHACKRGKKGGLHVLQLQPEAQRPQQSLAPPVCPSAYWHTGPSQHVQQREKKRAGAPLAASSAMPSRRGQLSCLATCAAAGAARETVLLTPGGRAAHLSSKLQLPGASQHGMSRAHQAHLGIPVPGDQQLVNGAAGSILHDKAGGLASDGQQVADIGVVQLAHHRGCRVNGRAVHVVWAGAQGRAGAGQGPAVSS